MTDSPRPARRFRIQFRLATLFWITLAVASFLAGWVCGRWYTERWYSDAKFLIKDFDGDGQDDIYIPAIREIHLNDGHGAFRRPDTPRR